jgi:hypothetical protein
METGQWVTIKVIAARTQLAILGVADVQRQPATVTDAVWEYCHLARLARLVAKVVCVQNSLGAGQSIRPAETVTRRTIP